MKNILIGLFIIVSISFSKEVTVSILPQKYFVKMIAGEKIDVNVMVREGFSPATYEPKTSQMQSLSKSLAYFSIGVPFESVWLSKFESVNKNMLIIDTSKGIEKNEMEKHEHHEEEHDEHEEYGKHEKEEHDEHEEHGKHEKEHHEDHEEHTTHEHSGLDPHIWLDPILVKVQVKNIYDGLVKIDSVNKDYYKNNYDALILHLDNLHTKLESKLKKYSKKAFMVFHPSWGYFAKRYDLEQISIEVEGKEPKPSQLVELIHEAKKHNIKVVFISPQFSKKGAKIISSSIKGNTLVIDPLSKKWDENLIKVSESIVSSY